MATAVVVAPFVGLLLLALTVAWNHLEARKAPATVEEDSRLPRPSIPDPPLQTQCGCSSRIPDVTLDLVATVQDYLIENKKANISAMYRTRTWCDGSKPAGRMCEGLGIFGPKLVVGAGSLLRVIIRNDFDIRETTALGPRPPTPADWFPLVDAKKGRYAGMQNCGWVFTGVAPSSPDGFKHDITNMPGHFKEGFEVTNIHLHGMEIAPHLFAPLGTSDPAAPFVHIKPGECQCYEFQIPADHPTGGTYWYHPHLHSSAAMQAWSGMAGLIVVPGSLDQTLENIGVVQDIPFAIWDPHFRQMREEDSGVKAPAFLNQQLQEVDAVQRRMLLGPRESIGTDYFLRDQTDQSNIWYLVNGEYQPSYKVRPGETIRLRLLCATTENLAGFEILNEAGQAVPFFQIGSDGVTFRAPVQRMRLINSGGQREELLIRLPDRGRYQIVSRGLSKVQFFCTGPDDAVLGFINVVGDALPQPLPDLSKIKLDPPRKPIAPEEIVTSRVVVMSMKADRSRIPFPQFQQNGKPYNETSVEFRVKAGTAEEWIVMNPDNTMHPIHLHINPFQVKEMHSSYRSDDPAMKEILRLDKDLDNWRDTVNVPPQGSVKIWVRWNNYKGKTVAHCHFLAHEDTGMMMNILLE